MSKEIQKIIFPECHIESKLNKIIEEDRRSDKKRIAKKCEDYYEGKHDIINYKVYYFNGDGELVEDTARSNIKISHPFYTELIDQKISYLLSDFSISSKDQVLDDELKIYFGDDFKDELADVSEDSSKIGFGYMYAQMDKDSRTKFKYARGIGIKEYYKDNSDELEYIIYYYLDRVDENKKEVVRIEVHDKEQTFYYVLRGNKLEKDEKKSINPAPHKIWIENKKDGPHYYGEGFGYIPFFRLDNNRKQISDLKPIKALIDDYDLMNCGLSNNLQDISEGIYVVKGYQGTDLTELQQNIKTKKIVGVGEDGDVDIKTITIPYDARKTKLELDEKNIYRFGMGFNSAQIGDGNITNIVIKSRYVLLELKCNKSERKLRPFVKQLVSIAINEINEAKGTSYTINDVDISLNRKTLTNELDNATIEKIKAETKQVLINTILNAGDSLPEETAIKEICDILDIDYDEIEAEIKEKIESEKLDLNKASDILINGIDNE